MYKFVKIEPDLYNHIRTLYSRCFNVDISILKIEKKYNTSSFGCRDIGFLAFDENNNPAAYYGVFPLIVKYKETDILIAQSGDTMTDPKHQKKGLFVQLASKTYEYAKQMGIQFIFGFPNENSYPGFKNKLNWIFTGEMQTFALINFTIPICEIAFRITFFESIYNQLVKITLRNLNIPLFPENILDFKSKEGYNIVIKDDDFFNYKLNNKNNHLIEFKGFKFLIKTNGHLIIGEVGYFDYSRLQSFLLAIKRLGLILFARKTVLSLSTGHWLFSYLKDELKPTDGLPIGFCKLNEVEFTFENIVFSQADFDTF